MEPLPAAAHHRHHGPTSIPLTYSNSGESSPLSRDTWEDHASPIPGGAPKLRLMCSFGGHIIPRPHDKSLCYVGGDTRIVAVDRRASLSDLSSRLSRSLLAGRPFTMKYQLPAEDLDSLISVTTDEDLDNMVEEYDRTAASSPSRLRLFLFFLKPETTASMGALLDDAKSETWFVDALNSTGLLPRGLSDSAAADCLLDLDHDGGGGGDDARLTDLDARLTDLDDNRETSDKIDPPAVVAMVENSNSNSSSFGSSSSSSSPSMSNLPPIRVRVEEQFAQLDFSSAHPPPIVPVSTPPTCTLCSDHSLVNHRGYSDDERSEQGVAVGFRKPPLPLQPPQHNKLAGFAVPPAGFSLPSPDSVTSDCSITSANSFSKPMLYQDNMGPISPNTNSQVLDSTSQIQDPNYTLDQQQQQRQHQQFVQYIPHTTNTGPVPVSSYYQIYAQPPQHQQQQQQQQQYQHPVYVMPMAHTQSYNMSMQSDHPATHPPVYPTKTPPPAMANTPLIQVPPNQFQQQFMGYQSTTPNYGFEYAHPDQVYYQHAPLPPQYQTMTSAAMAALTDAAAKQMPTNTAQ